MADSPSGAVPDPAREPVIVTGGRQGIGLAIAQAFLAAGYPVAIADVIDDDPGNSGDPGSPPAGDLLAVRCDVTAPAEVEALLDRVETRFGRPARHLVNNAAVQFWGPLLEADISDVARTLQVNVLGSYLMTQRFGRRRVAAGGGGSIVNLGSGCNAVAFPMLSAYTASKGAIETLTKAAALELGAHGIRVNCVAPGAIETERTRAETEGYAARWAPLTPLARVGTVDDVAQAVVALTGPGFDFVSGQTLGVDGGLFSRAVWPVEY